MDETPSERRQRLRQQDPELYARLKAESKAPYRGLRRFVYVSFGVSGLIGAFIFLTQVLAGRDAAGALPNLMLQIGVVGLMVWLFRLEQRAEANDQKRLNK